MCPLYIHSPQVALQPVADWLQSSLVEWGLSLIKIFLAEHLSKHPWGLFRLTLPELLCIISCCCFPNAAGTYSWIKPQLCAFPFSPEETRKGEEEGSGRGLYER